MLGLFTRFFSLADTYINRYLTSGELGYGSHVFVEADYTLKNYLDDSPDELPNAYRSLYTTATISCKTFVLTEKENISSI